MTKHCDAFLTAHRSKLNGGFSSVDHPRFDRDGLSCIQRFELAGTQPIFAWSRALFMPAQLMRVHSSGVPPPFQCVSRLTASE